MSYRPSITLCIMMKNEKHNLPVLIESVKDCFDEIHITDTGSTDGSKELVQEWIDSGSNPANSKISLFHFEWIQDFGAARNASIKNVATDYWMWMDLDDSLSDRDAFIKWRDQVMAIAEYWLATYQYATNAEGKAMCSFARERVIKTNCNLKWEYFLHEGVKPIKPDGTIATVNSVPAWRIIHRRTADDLQKDRGRNLAILERYKDRVDSRMQFYWGKELFEAQKPLEAYEILKEVIKKPDLEPHDRVLSFQYACFCLQQLGQFDKSIDMAFDGLKIAPNRAEFFGLIGDAYVKTNRIAEAIPFYHSAKNCKGVMPSASIQGPLFSAEELYTTHPRNNLARCYFALGDLEKAEIEARESFSIKETPESKGILEELGQVKKRTLFSLASKQTDEIVITGLPNGPYEWDENLYKTQGIGGSETAAIQMSRWIKKITGRPVKIFNNRVVPLHGESGVEYLPMNSLPDYMIDNIPKININWRHTTRVTNGKSVVWAHDLFTQGSENHKNYDEFLCLSPFHSDLSETMGQVPRDKIWVTRNGIDPEKIKFDRPKKNPNKCVYVSSPDRGLIDLIPALQIARKENPDLELHVYYGIEKLPLYGMHDLHNKLQKLFAENSWVKYHGFTEQNQMMRECADAAIWTHPATFIETSCISAMEMQALGVYSITRSLGALKDTLKEAEEKGMATLLSHGAQTDEEKQAFAKEVLRVQNEKRWEGVEYDIQANSWENVAKSWVDHFNL